MKILNSKNLMTIHLVSAAFMLPICMVFLITGVFYFIFEFDGNYEAHEHEVQLEHPLEKDIELMAPIVETELTQLGYPIPEGWTGVTKLDDAPYYQLEWHDGLDRIVKLKPGDEPLAAVLTVYEASLYKKLMLLHLAYGDNIFRIYAIVFSIILFLMFVTGYILAWRMKNNRNLVISSSLLSLVLFFLILIIQ